MNPQKNKNLDTLQANFDDTLRSSTAAETGQPIPPEHSINGWTGLATLFGIFSVIILINLFKAANDAITYYSAYATSKHDYVTDKQDKPYKFILFGPSTIKLDTVNKLIDPANEPILIETGSNTASLTETYRTLLQTQTTQQILKTATLLVLSILTTIATYFLISRHFIEINYSNAGCDKQGLENLQRSLDRSILRYNTLGLVLFCFTLLIVLVSGTLTFSLFASTIDNIKELEAAKDNIAVILLYIMRTSLLTAFLTTTIIVFYKFSKSAIDQSARFLKRKHATKFLKFLISKAEHKGTVREINEETISYFSTFFDIKKYLGGENYDIINIRELPELTKEIANVRRSHGLPDIPLTDITYSDPLLKNTCKNESLIKPLQQTITQRILYSNLNETLVNKLRLDDLEKLMKAFEIWNADIGSAFGDAPGKANNSTSISLNSLLKDEKK